MKIAVTYDNGSVFQHFGKTESFKVYEVEDNKVVSSEVIGSIIVCYCNFHLKNPPNYFLYPFSPV